MTNDGIRVEDFGKLNHLSIRISWLCTCVRNVRTSMLLWEVTATLEPFCQLLGSQGTEQRDRKVQLKCRHW